MGEGIVFTYKDKQYRETQLQKIIDFYNRMQFEGGNMYCPLCDCDLEENGVFVCEECHELMDVDQKCSRHDKGVCRSCCSKCCEEAQYEWEQEHRRDE
ncbi:MAG: hypothetical protein NC548_51555 [Lachnospiraceae bacterium]|nr:hypothetical protein [Lachnospiraceae bacterium]